MSTLSETGPTPQPGGREENGSCSAYPLHLKNPLEGYRRLTFMMLDADIVAVSPTSVWRVLG
jgi:putative transposase